MKCPTCQEKGLISTVIPQGSRSTCLYNPGGYYNEYGNWVSTPDPNTYTTDYRCSNGHDFSKSTQFGKTNIHHS